MRSLLPTPETVLTKDKSKLYAEYPSYGAELQYAQIEGDKVYVLSPPTCCKDYLTDALAWNDEDYDINQLGVGCYKFKADYDKENTTLYLGFYVGDKIKVLNEFEESIGVEPTKHFRVGQGASAVCGDKWWMTTTIHFSMFMSLLRYIQAGTDVDTLMTPTLQNGKDPYVRRIWSRMRLLPHALKKLDITIKRNSPTIELQHAMNGHYCLLTNAAIRPRLTYGPQLMERAPEVFSTPVEA